MCRLFAYVAPHRSSVRDVLGVDQAMRFTRMARLHKDGWGTAWIDHGSGQDAHVEIERHAGSALGDERFRRTLNEHRARARLLHLRLASVGRATHEENSHPFTGDGMAFAHNGSIVPKTGLFQLVAEPFRSAVAGTTDSELYFAMVRERVARGMTPSDALRATVQTLRNHFPLASLNAILLTRDEVVVAHVSTTAPVPVEEFAPSACAIPSEELPTGHLKGYYGLWEREMSDGSYAVSSSGLDFTGWSPVAPDSIVTINIHTGVRTTLPFNVPVQPLSASELRQVTYAQQRQLSA